MDASVPPAGYIARRLQLSDAGRVAAVVAACEEHDVGEVLVEEADVVGDWQRPGFDLATCAVGLEHDGEVVAYVEIYGARRAEGHVLPGTAGTGSAPGSPPGPVTRPGATVASSSGRACCRGRAPTCC